MRLFAGIAATFLLTLFATYGAYVWAFPSGTTLRYRLTLEVEADGQVYSGSGVIEVQYEIPPRWMLGANRVVSRVRGEAITVELGTRGILCALLIGAPPALSGGYVANAEAIPLRAFGIAPSIGAIEEEALRKLSSLSARSEMSFSSLPMLVWFSDPNDPKTVALADPSEFGTGFIPGTRLKRAAIETTHDPVTTGIEKKLPWLPRKKGVPGTITGAKSYTPGRPELNLTGITFTTELFR
jgi:hypothetical protein